MRHLPNQIGRKVEVYRNIHHSCLSIRSLGLVLGHAQYVRLKDVRFVVRPTGRQRVLESKQKNVHAFAKGILVQASNEPLEPLESYSRVSYNPYRAGHFYRVADGSPIYEAETVLVTVDGVYLIEGVLA